MIQSLINKSFNIFDLNELNEFFRIFHVFFALISFFRKFLSLHFNKFFMIVTISRLFILILRNFLKMIEIIRSRRLRLKLSRLTRVVRHSRFRRNVKDLWKLVDFSFLFVMFDTRKNFSIALFWIKKLFWYLLWTWWNDNDDDENDYLNKIDENLRVFKSKKSVSLEKSKVNFRKNWLEMIDENSLKEEL
jgi:hypothetical protein